VKRARQGVNVAVLLAMGSALILIVVLMCFTRPLLMLFTQDESVIEFGTIAMQVVTPFYLLLCFNQIYAGALRGIGQSKTPMYIMLGSFVVFRQIYLTIARALSSSFTVVALSYPMGWMLCSVLLFFAYRRSAMFAVTAVNDIQEKNNAPA